MPIPFDPKRLNAEDGIVKTMEENKASYHESWYLKFKATKLERKKKSVCKGEEAKDATCAKFTCSSQKKAAAEGTEDSDVKDQEMGVCFICDIQAPIKDLRLASTLPL